MNIPAFIPLTLLTFSLLFTSAAHAERKLALHISDDDERVQSLVLSNASNVQKALGMDNVIIEIVAYGPGLSLVTSESKFASRVKSLIVQDILFTACGNTLDTIERNSGKRPELLEGVEVVQAGVIRLMDLQQQGYHYIRP
jgi:uncharacterized protein